MFGNFGAKHNLYFIFSAPPSCTKNVPVPLLACLHDQNKLNGFLVGRLLSSQLEHFEKLS